MVDRSFGFETAVQECTRAINSALVEAMSCEYGVGIVKLMGRASIHNSQKKAVILVR